MIAQELVWGKLLGAGINVTGWDRLEYFKDLKIGN